MLNKGGMIKIKEKDGYRENLACILNFTDGRHTLTLKDVRAFTGIKDNRTLKKRYSFTDGRISASTLAKEMI